MQAIANRKKKTFSFFFQNTFEQRCVFSTQVFTFIILIHVILSISFNLKLSKKIHT
jgi:hypothetical protein